MIVVRPSSRVLLAATLIGCLGVVSAGQTPMPAQTAQRGTLAPRTVVRGRGFFNDPIRIAEILYDGRPIKSSVPFEAPDDWISHLSVTLRNASSKTLIAGHLHLDFQEPGKPAVFHEVRFGLIPEHQLYSASGVKAPPPAGETPISVPPGETITIHLSDYYSSIEPELAARGPLSETRQCGIDYGLFYFTDGLRWGTNSYAQEDPLTPGGYLPAKREDLMPTDK